MRRVKFVGIYFLLLVFLILGYFVNNPLSKTGVYEKVNQYIGIVILPTLLFFILYGLIFMVKDKKKRVFYEIKLYLVFIFIFFGIFLYVLYGLNINFVSAKTFSASEEFYRNLISESLFRYRLGYLPTYIFYEMIRATEKFGAYPFYYFYYALVAFEVMLPIGISFNPVRKYLKKRAKDKKERKEREIIEARLQEQIKIKEELEKKEREKLEKSKQLEEQILNEKVTDYKKEKRRKRQKEVDEKLVVRMAGTDLQKIVTINQDDMSTK